MKVIFNFIRNEMMKQRIKKRTGQKNKPHRREPRCWILSATAIGMIVAFTVGNSRAMNVGFVANDGGAQMTRKFSQDENGAVTKFNIPAGNLSEVLAVFEKQTGWRVTIAADLRNIFSPGVAGEFTNEQALKQILLNTNVVYTFDEPTLISLKLAGVSAAVEVTAENTIAVTSPKYTEPLRDTAQTITVINQDAIKEQGATTLRDVLKNVTGLTVTAGEGGNVGGDNLTLRGFSARNDIYVDNARDLSPQNRDPFNLEQVEVVKGPSSATTGRGSAGGSVNLVTKSPNLQPTYSFDLTGGTDHTKRITGDINIPLERFNLGDRNAFRVNFVGHDSNYAGRERVRSTREGIAPSLLVGLSEKTTLTVGYFFLGQNNIQDYGIPFVPPTNNVLTAFRDRPAPVPRQTFYGYVDRDKEYLKSHLGTVTLNHAFNDKMTLRNQFRYDHSSRNSLATTPRLTSDNSGTQVNREIKTWLTTDQTYDNQTDFTARFKTGFVEHALVAGTEFIHENSRRYLRSAATEIGRTDLYQPNPDDVYTGIVYTNPLPSVVKAETQAFYAFDTLKLHPKFEISGGLRYERYHADGFLLPVTTLPTATQPLIFGTTRAAVDKLDNLFNLRLAAIYKPIEKGTFYASYGTASNPSLSGLLYENATVTNLDPEKTKTYEAGTKWDLFKNRLLLSGALFRVIKTNARTPQPDGTLQILDGRQRVDGIELSATGNITGRWNILSGYTLLSSRIVESNAFTTVSNVKIYEVGNRFINTPRNSFSLYSTYKLPFKASIGGGARFVDLRYANTINTRFVDSYWLYEATASYQITKHIDVRLNGYNLGNKYYFDRISGGHAVPGPGRSLLVSTGFRF